MVKFFWVGIDSKCFETYFKLKISESTIFSSVNFFLWDSVFFGQNGQNSKKRQRQKILVEKFFWSESIQNVSKRILNRKSRNLKFFPCKFFSWDYNVFRPKWWKNDKVKNFWSKFFLVGIDSECFETHFKTKISKSKIFPITKFFRGT